MRNWFTIFAFAAAVACGSAASAADYEPQWPRIADHSAQWPRVSGAVQYPAVNWSGFYVGWNVGGAFARGTASGSAAGVSYEADQDLPGFIGGAQAGYGWQFGKTVFGLEADIQASSQSHDVSVCGGCATSYDLKDEMPWFTTFRARAGYAFDRYMLYATGGGAYVGLKSKLTMTALGASTELASWSDTRPAWVAGGGIEYKWFDGWEGRLEYLYLDTGNFDASANVAGLLNFTTSLRVTEHIFRAGMNYRF